jgi:hypothetical protein
MKFGYYYKSSDNKLYLCVDVSPSGDGFYMKHVLHEFAYHYHQKLSIVFTEYNP